ncbi:MAG: Jag N-terminal domain-containing protein [Ruminococcus sp.]|nr:Jag N-terminal domain-containing protein [Ruminococcus sp.]
MKQEFTAKTLEEARAAAAAAFGVSEDEITFTVLTEPKKGLLGLGKTDAKVSAEYNPPKTKIEQAESYIKAILEKMGITNDLKVSDEDGGAFIEIVGETSGVVIGRRGETLDSIQYLASMSANRGTKDYFRVTLDCNGYRDKRREVLTELAKKISHSVIKTGRATTLEAMNPYERRIIHSAVGDIEGVVSKSIGDEPYRRVVISSVLPRVTATYNRTPKPGFKDGNRSDRSDRTGKSGDRNDHYGRRDTRDNRDSRRNDDDLPRKPVDIMKSSFERDYKKPKPEDSYLSAGSLYDKIDL